jgi:hypothetical protein
MVLRLFNWRLRDRGIYFLCVPFVIYSLRVPFVRLNKRRNSIRDQTGQDSYKEKTQVLDGSLFNLLRALYAQGQASYSMRKIRFVKEKDIIKNKKIHFFTFRISLVDEASCVTFWHSRVLKSHLLRLFSQREI